MSRGSWSRHYLVAGCSAVAAAVVALPWVPHVGADAPKYLAIATGHLGGVHEPFASRLLAPYAARVLTHLPGVDVHAAFLLLGTVSLAIFAIAVAGVLSEQDKVGSRWLVLLFTPLTVFLFRDYFLPDVLFAALVALFLLAVWREQRLLSLGIVCLAALSRPSGALLLASVAAVVLWRGDQRRWAGLVVGACTAGYLGASLYASSHALGNIHGLPGPLYLLAKLPFNALKNLLGISVYTDTLANCDPMWIKSLPELGFLGQIRSVGICSLSPETPLRTFLALGAVTGTAPGVLAVTLRREFRPSGARPITIALAYGGLMWVLGSMTGASVGRLTAYGWPLLLLALPLWLREVGLPTRTENSVLVLCFLVAWCSLPLFTDEITLFVWGLLILVFAVLAANVYCAWLVYRHAARNESVGIPVSPRED